MKHTTKNLLALVLFACSMVFFIAASSINETNIMVDDCYHCGSVSACEDGGQSYGWSGCVYNPDLDPPENCSVFGGSGCGTEPGEN